jgi:hypothetical protein
VKVRDAYAFGLIEDDELDRYAEREVLQAAGRRHPVPPGWEPLPPCDHEWIDVTQFDDRGREYLCARCGDRQFKRLPLTSSEASVTLPAE